MAETTTHTKSSGNIFKDLDFDNPKEWHAKATLAAHILRVIKKRGLTQAAAAKLFGISQPEISNLKHGQFHRFSIDRLFRFLGALDQQVTISISPRLNTSSPIAITVDALG